MSSAGPWVLTLNVLVAVVTGVLASLLTLLIDRKSRAGEVAKKVKLLEGTYDHVALNGTVCTLVRGGNARTSLTHLENGYFSVRSHTDYCDWSGRLRIDPDMPTYGAGTFEYDDPDKGTGRLQVIRMGSGGDFLVEATAMNFSDFPSSVYLWKATASG